MMNVSEEVPSQECSSGCESGWTLYLEHSNSRFSNDGLTNKESFGKTQKQEFQKIEIFEEQYDRDGYLFGEQEEDLSMVSDASSGPPHFDHGIEEDEVEYGLCYNKNNDGRLKKQCRKSYALETQSCSNYNTNNFALDDTASSHVFASNYKDNIGAIHVQNNEGASFERFINYSSQDYPATHIKVGLDGRKSRRQK